MRINSGAASTASRDQEVRKETLIARHDVDEDFFPFCLMYTTRRGDQLRLSVS